MLSAGLMLICHGPWLLPAVCAASLSPTSLFLSSTYLLCPVFHCFQTQQRSRRLIHWSRAPVKYSLGGGSIIRNSDIFIRRRSDYETTYVAAAGRDFGGGRQNHQAHQARQALSLFAPPSSPNLHLGVSGRVGRHLRRLSARTTTR